jgi:SPP1 gp7 family putative phage head morphogenesis protein
MAKTIDPTRTGLIRRQFIAEMNRRFKWLRQQIRKFLVTDDRFGLKETPKLKLKIHQAQEFRFLTNPQKLKTFQTWLTQQVNAGVLSVEGITGQPWTNKYIQSAYRQGLVRAYTDTNPAIISQSPDFYTGSQKQFLQTAFAQPELMSKVELLATRTFEQLKGVTATMSQQMNRILADGLLAGYGPEKIAREMNNTIGKLTRTRARTIARTEVIHAHAEGQLDSFEMLGVEDVVLMAEWSTAQDERVCPECEPLDGWVMTVDQARNLIPRHPNCRCAWLPAGPKKEKGQIRGTVSRKIAVKKSIQAERPRVPYVRAKRQSTWAGKRFSTAGGKLPTGGGGQLPAKRKVIKRVRRVKELEVKKIVDKVAEQPYLEVFKKGTKEYKYIRDKTLQAYKGCGIEPGAGAGYCDQVSIKMWDLMGRPKSLRPYTVMWAEEEHVLLYSSRTGLIIDPTGSQFGNKVISMKGKGGYKSFMKMTDNEIKGTREIMKVDFELL